MQVTPRITQFVTGGGTNIVNQPINLTPSIRAYADYTRPSSSDSSPLPSIRFLIEGRSEFWVYETQEDRDKDLDIIGSLWSEGNFDPYWDVSRGVFPDKQYFFVFGLNHDVDSGDKEDVWNVGGEFPYYDVAVPLNLSSTSVNDTLTGTGARVVRVVGLDDNWDLVHEDVEMDGTNTVTTTVSFLRHNGDLVILAGGSGFNEGDIVVRNSVNNDILGRIDAEMNNSQMSHFSVPRNAEALVLSGTAYINKPSGQVRQAEFFFKCRPFGSVFSSKPSFLLSDNVAFSLNIKGVVPIPEKSDIKIVVDNASTNNCSVSTFYEIILFYN